MNLETRIRTVLAWIHTFLLLEGVYILATGFLGLDKTAAAQFDACGFVLFFPIILSWICLRKMKNMWLFLLSGAALTFVWIFLAVHSRTGFLPSFFLLTGILTAVLFLVRCQVRIRRGKIRRMLREMPGNAEGMREPELWEIPTIFDEPGPGYFAVFAAYYLAALVLGFDSCLRPIFRLLLAEILVCLASRYLGNLSDYVEANQNIANLPVKTMRRVSQMILMLLFAGLLIFLLPGILYKDEPLTRITWKLQGLQTPDEPMESSYEGGGMSMEELLAEYGLDDTPRETPAWLEATGNILMWVLGIALTAALLWSIWMALRHASASFSQDEEDEVISLDTDESGEVSAASAKSRRPGWFSPEMRIRRRYKKAITKGLKTAPAGSETPQELEEKAEIANAENQPLHTLYEKARYSHHACTPEDLQGLR